MLEMCSGVTNQNSSSCVSPQTAASLVGSFIHASPKAQNSSNQHRFGQHTTKSWDVGQEGISIQKGRGLTQHHLMSITSWMRLITRVMLQEHIWNALGTPCKPAKKVCNSCSIHIPAKGNGNRMGPAPGLSWRTALAPLRSSEQAATVAAKKSWSPLSNYDTS